MKDINLEKFKKIFNSVLSEEGKSILESLYVFGSLARGEKIQAGSDIDTVLVLKNNDKLQYEDLLILNRDLKRLDNKLGVDVDHVLCTQDDLFELLAPTLILNLHADGVNVFGRDLKERFKEYLDECSKNDMLNSFLRTNLFRRHLTRKKYIKLNLEDISKISEDTLYGISKDIILTARDLIFFEKDKLITPKREICSYFLANFTGSDDFVNHPMLSFNVRYGNVKLSNDKSKMEFLRKSLNFIEYVNIMLQEKYKTVTGKKTLDIRPF